MLDRSRFLILHGADPKRWAKRYGIEPVTHPCDRCGRPCTTTIPFACGGLRGLKAPTCECGNESTPYCVVAARGDLFDVLAPRGRPS